MSIRNIIVGREGFGGGASIALACIAGPLLAGVAYFVIASPAERPGVYVLTRHQEFPEVPFTGQAAEGEPGEIVTLDVGASPVKLFRTGEDDVVSFFVLEPEPDASEQTVAAAQVLFLVGSAGERPLRLKAWRLLTKVERAGARLYRITSTDWEVEHLHRLLDSVVAGGSADRGTVEAYLALTTGTESGMGRRYYLVPLGPPFLWDAALR